MLAPRAVGFVDLAKSADKAGVAIKAARNATATFIFVMEASFKLFAGVGDPQRFFVISAEVKAML
jgi:hypothetical protein